MLETVAQTASMSGLPQSLPPTPGIYPGSAQAVLLRPGTYLYILKNTQLTAGQSSIAFQLERTKSTFSYPIGFAVEITFATAPGAFEVDLQTSDTDQDVAYVTLAKLTSGLNANNWGRIEVVAFWALFARLNFSVLTNSGLVTAKVTR